MTFKISSESLISRFGSSSFSWQGDVKNTNPLEFFSWSESPIGLLSTHTWHWRFSEVPCRVDVFRLGRTCVSAELRRLSITFHCLHDDSFLNANTFKNVSSFSLPWMCEPHYMQNDVKSLLSHSTAAGGKLLCAHPQFRLWTYQRGLWQQN